VFEMIAKSSFQVLCFVAINLKKKIKNQIQKSKIKKLPSTHIFPNKFVFKFKHLNLVAKNCEKTTKQNKIK
jgi:hypothetical protein